MANITRVFQEMLPNVKLIGRRYTNADRDASGSFGPKWGEWFENGYFESLEKCAGVRRVSDDYFGAMRDGSAGFEYWIGMLAEPGSDVPEGFEAIEISGGPLGVCYVRGRADSAELFGCDVHDACVAAWTAQELAWVDARLTGFKGRATRDDWVSQAKKLATGWRPESKLGDKPAN